MMKTRGHKRAETYLIALRRGSYLTVREDSQMIALSHEQVFETGESVQLTAATTTSKLVMPMWLAMRGANASVHCTDGCGWCDQGPTLLNQLTMRPLYLRQFRILPHQIPQTA